MDTSKAKEFLKQHEIPESVCLNDKDLTFINLVPILTEFANQQTKSIKEEWISVEERLPELDPENIRAFSLFIKATNNRYYTGYATKEYGKTTFFQHNGRNILRVTHWREIEPLPQPPKELQNH